MTFEKLEHSQIKAHFEVSAEEFSAALDEAFTICNAKVTIKGFRKGKAPKTVYLKNYGVESLYADAIDVVVGKKMREELLVNEELAIASQPMLDLDYNSVAEGKGFTFTLTFDTYPEVKLGQYKGIEVVAQDNEPTNDELANETNRLLKDKVVVETKEGAIENGDLAVFDFVGSVDGVEFPGGKAENYELKIGSGQFIPGFEDQMGGMVAGTEKDITVTFPENYGEKSLTCKEAVFHITLHEVKAEKTPDLTDELVKELNIENVNTVLEFHDHVKTSLTTRKTNYNNRMLENQVIEAVVNNAEIDLPKTFVKERENSLRSQAEAQAKQYNIPFEMFLQFSGVTVEAFNEQCHEEALRQVKSELVLDEIAKVEGLLPTDEEINEAVSNYAASAKMSLKDVEKRIGKAAFAANIAANKAIKFVLDAKVVK